MITRTMIANSTFKFNFIKYLLLEYPSYMILNYSLFSVHRKIQYYMDDVNFRIDQKGFSSISYDIMYFHPRIYICKDSCIRREARGTGTYVLYLLVLFVYGTQLEELDIHHNLDEISRFYGAKCPCLQYLPMYLGGNILG